MIVWIFEHVQWRFALNDRFARGYIRHMKTFSRGFFLDRVRRCKADPSYKGCFPLLWSLSPQLLHLAPDWLRWYYDLARQTTHDYFVLPASGDLYR